MKLYFLKEEALETLRGNIKSNLKKYTNPTNEWIYEYFDGVSPFGEYKIEVLNFQLDMSEEKPQKTDLENIKRVYKNFNMLSESQAIDERLWAGLAHNNFWEYMQYRWFSKEKKLTERNIKTKFFFDDGKIRSLMVHPIAKLWWAGKLTYDSKRENPFELTEFFRNDFITRNLYLFSSKFSNNPKIVRALLSVMIDIENQGRTITTDEFNEMIKYLNVLGGTYILDYFSEEELAEKIRIKLEDLVMEKAV